VSVTAVSAISQIQDSPRREHDAMQQASNDLQQASSAGSLEQAQKAAEQATQHVEDMRPPENGVRPAPSVNPEATRRVDMQVLQSALDSGDLPAAQEALVRMEQDSQQISSLQQDGQNLAASALSSMNGPQNDAGMSAGSQPEKTTGNLIDVMA
jgi:hypothetical protein